MHMACLVTSPLHNLGSAQVPALLNYNDTKLEREDIKILFVGKYVYVSSFQSYIPAMNNEVKVVQTEIPVSNFI